MGTGLGGRGQKTGPEPHNFLKRDDRKLELRNLRTVTPWLKSPNKGFHGTRGDPSITAPARGLSPPRSLQAPTGSETSRPTGDGWQCPQTSKTSGHLLRKRLHVSDAMRRACVRKPRGTPRVACPRSGKAKGQGTPPEALRSRQPHLCPGPENREMSHVRRPTLDRKPGKRGGQRGRHSVHLGLSPSRNEPERAGHTKQTDTTGEGSPAALEGQMGAWDPGDQSNARPTQPREKGMSATSSVRPQTRRCPGEEGTLFSWLKRREAPHRPPHRPRYRVHTRSQLQPCRGDGPRGVLPPLCQATWARASGMALRCQSCRLPGSRGHTGGRTQPRWHPGFMQGGGGSGKEQTLSPQSSRPPRAALGCPSGDGGLLRARDHPAFLQMTLTPPPLHLSYPVSWLAA